MSALGSCFPTGGVSSVGSPGADGVDGNNAYTFLTADLGPLPAVGGTITAYVQNNLWMALSQIIFIGDGTSSGYFRVISFSGSTAVLLQFISTPDAASTINANATVSPSAQSEPMPFGWTSSTSKSVAQGDLGLGQGALIWNSTGLTQVITDAPVAIGSCIVSVVNPGNYLLFGKATVSMDAVTFLSSRTITLRIINVQTNTVIASSTYPTLAMATATTIPSFDIMTNLVTDDTAVATQQYRLEISIDTVNDSGTLAVSAGSLCAVPLSLD
jgi:hypothetical protein